MNVAMSDLSFRTKDREEQKVFVEAEGHRQDVAANGTILYIITS